MEEERSRDHREFVGAGLGAILLFHQNTLFKTRPAPMHINIKPSLRKDGFFISYLWVRAGFVWRLSVSPQISP
jgi:hypothetical protein